MQERRPTRELEREHQIGLDSPSPAGQLTRKGCVWLKVEALRTV
jgi:hypothetical protein